MSTHDSFDERAATWDENPGHADRARAVAARIDATVPLTPQTRVLEYGAGTGLVTQALAGKVGDVTLADTSSGMRAVLHAKIDNGALPASARVWDVDLSTSDPPPEMFDLVVTVMTLHHIPQLDDLLRRFGALLSPGGHLCIVDLDREDGSFHGRDFAGHQGFDRRELSAALRNAGFADVTIADCYRMHRDERDYSLFLAVGTRDGATTPSA